MSGREWKPGDLAFARVTTRGQERRLVQRNSDRYSTHPWRVLDEVGGQVSASVVEDMARAVVLDPKWNPEGLDYLHPAHFRRYAKRLRKDGAWVSAEVMDWIAAQLPDPNPKPQEPTDPRAYVEDARENIWRLLADGDWVCTSGPDIGEYIDWFRLTERYGPLTISGVES